MDEKMSSGSVQSEMFEHEFVLSTRGSYFFSPCLPFALLFDGDADSSCCCCCCCCGVAATAVAAAAFVDAFFRPIDAENDFFNVGKVLAEIDELPVE